MGRAGAGACVGAGLCLFGALALAVARAHGWTLYYGDAEAHLNIARRIVDSRTPGYEQIGTVWLPLPHLLALPFARYDALWQSGMAGAIPAALCFAAAGVFLFAASSAALGSAWAGVAAAGIFALNPNMLYLAATPMTEAVFFAAVLALLWSTVSFARSDSMGAAACAGLASLASTLTRYEGWFLIPFVCAFFLAAGKRKRLAAAILFGAIASLGPLYWLAHNRWFYGNALEFYNGPGSAQAIYRRALDAGLARYPGDGDWAKAALYYGAAVRDASGWAAILLGAAGLWGVLRRRAFWPAIFLALAPSFYVWSMHSAGTPIFVPEMWPRAWYNTRYGLEGLPLLAFCGAGAVMLAPARHRGWAALAVLLAAAAPWAIRPRAADWICWKETQVNSAGRRAWTHAAAAALRENYRPGAGAIASFGDLTGVFRVAGIPLRETLHEGNGAAFAAALARPDLFLHEEWALAMSGDAVATAIQRTWKRGPRYDVFRTIAVPGAPVIQIYRRRAAAPPDRPFESP